MINYAVVGAGWISQIAFLPGVAQSGNSRVAAIVTGDRTKAAQLAEFHGIGTVVGYDGYDALLASPEIDAVYIALPNDMHADFAIRAARAGKHVMVEKPLAVSEDESLAMIAAAREANVFLMTAYRLHNEPGTVAVLEHIRADAIGRPLFFQSAFSFQMASDNHRLKATAWGGPLQDLGVYCVNAARHVFAEEPIEAMAMAHRPNERRALQRSRRDSWPPRCDFPRAASRNSSPVSAGRRSTAIASWGRSGDLELDPGYQVRDGDQDSICAVTEKRSRPQFPQIDHFGAQVAYFSDCIEVGTPPEADGEEGLADMRALLAIEKACCDRTTSSDRLARRVRVIRPRIWCGSHHRRIGASFCDALARVSVSTSASTLVHKTSRSARRRSKP